MKINKLFKILVVILLAGALQTVAVNAFGISGSYNENTNPLVSYPGMETVVELRLQNTIADDDVLVSASLAEGAGIASMSSEEYGLPVGAKGVIVPVTIAVPETTPLGSEYTVVVRFETVTDGESGGVGLGFSTNYKFKVLVGEEPQEQPPVDTEPMDYTLLWAALTLIVTVIVVWLIVRSRKK